jgi:DNA end-binding protein Ku
MRLSLVSVPVQAFSTRETDKGAVTLHQLHDKDTSRVRYVKTCPLHGEIGNDEIVSGYEVAKDEYVVIDPDEIDKLRTTEEKAIQLETFVPADSIDSLYFDGRAYYLLPDGEGGVKPYAVLHQAMLKQRKWAVGQAVMFGREHLVLVRPFDKLLSMAFLNFAAEVRLPDTFDIGEVKVRAAEVNLAETLIKASTAKRFDINRYKDEYATKLRALIDAKIEGREIVAPEADERPHVVNLMDALRESVAKASGSKKLKPPKKLAVSHRSQVAGKRRRSS